MNNRIKSILSVALAAIIIFGFAIWGIVEKDKAFSKSERRTLASMPETSVSSILSGKFMSEFEAYTLDQFPLRDTFRTLKALNTYYVFGQRDNNGLYAVNGSIAKLDYPLNEESILRAAERFSYVYKSYLEGNGIKTYLSIIPDKNYFLAEKSGRLSIDYDKLVNTLRQNMDYAEYIDIFGTLSADDYYNADLHWRQEKLIDTARAVCMGLGSTFDGEYTANPATDEFYGVYYGQSALPLKAEELYTMHGGAIDDLSVYDHETDSYISVYDDEALNGRDPYETYLYGSKSLITMENPQCDSGRSLLIFRDSFASSLAPLLTEGFERITLVDIRYVSPNLLGRMIDFEGYTDALFIYNSAVINNSEALK